jgi:hypothetical protein
VADKKSNRKGKDTGTPGGSRPLQRRLYLTHCWNATKISSVGEGQRLWLLESLPIVGDPHLTLCELPKNILCLDTNLVMNRDGTKRLTNLL